MAYLEEKVLSRQLAQQVLEVRQAGLSDQDRYLIRQHLLDSLASALVGCRSAEFRDLFTQSLGEGDGSRLAPWEVQNLGMLWGFAINGSVYEDGSREGACHPAAAVMPVVLALAAGKSWDLIDRSIMAGYDVMVALARAGNPHFAKKGFHATAIAAPFGAAATVAQLLEYDLATTQHALCLAAMGCSGLMSSFKKGSTQPLQVAWGVRSGMAAALMAGQGHTGYPPILEEGFFPAYLGFDASEGLLRPFEFGHAISGCYLKSYPGCRHVHASLEAFLEIDRDHSISAESIAAIKVGTYGIAISTGIASLQKRGDAYFNIPYAIASRIVLGRSDYDAFDERHFSHGTIRELMAKTSLAVDPEIEGLYPNQRGSRVEVVLNDGSSLVGRVRFPLGEPETSLPVSNTLQKLEASAAGLLKDGEKKALAGMLDLSAGTPLSDCFPAGLLGSAVFL